MARKPNYLTWGILLIGGYLLYEEAKKKAAAATIPVLPNGNTLPSTGQTVITPPAESGNTLPSMPSTGLTIIRPAMPGSTLTTTPVNQVNTNINTGGGSALLPGLKGTVNRQRLEL